MAHHDVIGTWNVPGVRVRHPMVGSSPWLIRCNSVGMRDDRDFPTEKPETRRRLLLLGDSFTFGYGVDADERFSSLLEARDAGLEVLNFGLCSSGMDQQYLVYREIASRFESDAVLWTPFANNVARCALSSTVFQSRHGAPEERRKATGTSWTPTCTSCTEPGPRPG